MFFIDFLFYSVEIFLGDVIKRSFDFFSFWDWGVNGLVEVRAILFEERN